MLRLAECVHEIEIVMAPVIATDRAHTQNCGAKHLLAATAFADVAPCGENQWQQPTIAGTPEPEK